MDCLTFSTPCEALQCVAVDAQRLTALLQDDGPRAGEDADDLDHGFTLEHDPLSGRLFICAVEGQCNPEALPAGFCQALGEIAQRAGMEAIEFGVAKISTRFTVNSHGGYRFRILRDGRLVYPTLCWPTLSGSPTPPVSTKAEAIESPVPLPTAVNGFEAALAVADPILAALDAVLAKTLDLEVMTVLARAVREDALELVTQRLTSVLEKIHGLYDRLAMEEQS